MLLRSTILVREMINLSRLYKERKLNIEWKSGEIPARSRHCNPVLNWVVRSSLVSCVASDGTGLKEEGLGLSFFFAQF